MKFTFRTYEQKAGPKAAPFLTPLTIDLPSVEAARAMLKELTGHKDMLSIAVDIDSEDRTISERWFRQIAGWTRDDTQAT